MGMDSKDKEQPNGKPFSRTLPLLSGFWEKSGALLWPRDRHGGRYVDLLRSSPWTVFFCFAFVFSSGFGQTFFISLFQARWQSAFDLSPGQMGSLYGIATLASGLCLPFGGRWLDRTTPAKAGKIIFSGLAAAAVLTAASLNAWMLGLALFGLRFSGQGMSATLGTTCAARWFEHNRGRAVSLTGLGYPASEAIMPIAAALAISLMGWRAVWLVSALAIVAIGIPVVMASLKRGHRECEAVAELETVDTETPSPEGNAPVKSVWKDIRFYLMIGVVAPLPFVGTGVIFFQATLAESRDWNMALFPTGFLLFAIVRAFVSLSAGAWVDRVGAQRLIAIPGLAFALGVAALLPSNPLVIVPFFTLMGISFGAAGAIMTSAFTELFGKERIGAVRGASSSISVFLTAAAPALFGWLLAGGIGIESILAGCTVLLAVLPGACSFVIHRMHRD